MIEARGLVKRYRSTLAVDNLSFDVRPGAVTGFLGPNGAGKSTPSCLITAGKGQRVRRGDHMWSGADVDVGGP
jgi:ABC-type multidrug transport system ATPase subunit